MKSKLFTVDRKDAARALVLSIMTAAGTALLQILNLGEVPNKESIKTIFAAGAAGGLSYILKNFFTNSNDQLLKKEDPNV